MGRRRKEKSLLEELVNVLYIVVLLVSIKVWLSTKSTPYAIVTFVIGLGVILAIIYGFKQVKHNRLLNSGMDIIDEMSGETFEEFLLSHFRNLGYNGNMTPSSADYGADLVLEKDGRKLVVQAKRWKQIVGIEAVQQVVGAIKYYNAHKGMVITNSYFSENAYELANSNGVELWDRPKLIELMSKSGGRKIAQEVKSKSPTLAHAMVEVASTVEENCPRCGEKMVIRNGKKGRFLGCSAFPKCRFTKDLELKLN